MTPILGILASSRAGLPVSGASLWLDADDANTFSYSSGTRVSEWRDKSGNGYHFTQGTAAYQPNRNATVNGKSAVILREANGTGPYWVENSSWNWANQAFTVLTVIRTNTGAFSAAFGQDLLGRVVLGVDSSNPSILSISRIGEATTASNLTIARDTVAQATWKSAGVSAGSVTAQIYKNKVAANSTSTIAITSTASRSMIGASRSNLAPNVVDTFQAGATTSGVVCEVIVYPSQLNNTDREAVEQYLIDKWGVT